MTDTRERRIAVLTAAAKAKSQRAAHAADQAIRSLVKRGEPITFQSVQREAGRLARLPLQALRASPTHRIPTREAPLNDNRTPHRHRREPAGHHAYTTDD